MRLFTLLLFSLFIIATANAQQVKPIYFAGNVITADSTKATSYAVYGKLSTEELWSFKRYDLWDNLLQTGSFKDEELSIPHGKFTYYMSVEYFNTLTNNFFYIKDKHRFISQIGSFENGKETGNWYTFYPDGSVFVTVKFTNGLMNGEYKSYTRKGVLESSGNYVDGKKNGEWMFHSGLQIDVYEMDELKSSLKSKKLIRKESRAAALNNE